MAGTVILPDLYAPWIESLLGGPIPAETRATCGDCAMAKPAGPGGPPPFDSRLKCCTSWPTLPNFLVGRILRGDGHRGLAAIVRGEANGIATPLGVGCDPAWFATYEAASARFGRDAALRCPYLADDANGATTSCSLWRERPSTCAGYYCLSDRGEAGLAFWARMLGLLTAVEDALRRWCLIEMDLPGDVLATLDARLSDPAAARTGVTGDVWGPWEGRREEFFVATATLVDGLAWSDVERVGGPFVALPARLLRDAFPAMRPPSGS